MRNKLLVSGVVIAAAIAFYVHGSKIYSKKDARVTRIASAPVREAKLSEREALDAREVAVKKRLPENPWGRDPFELPLGVQLMKAGEEKTSYAVKPNIKKVTAILITDSRKVVSINHKVVAVGDLIDGEKVLEIKPDGVILERDGQRHLIALEEKPIRWTKNDR